MGFEKYRVSAQKPKLLAFGFTEKCLFMIKNGQKYVFHPREAHILNRLDITELYTIFCGFKKYRILAQNQKRLAFGFTEILLFATKTRFCIG
jgi:hypothetical protein